METTRQYYGEQGAKKLCVMRIASLSMNSGVVYASPAPSVNNCKTVLAHIKECKEAVLKAGHRETMVKWRPAKEMHAGISRWTVDFASLLWCCAWILPADYLHGKEPVRQV